MDRVRSQQGSGLRLPHSCPESKGGGHSFVKNKKRTLALPGLISVISYTDYWVRLLGHALPLASVPHQEERVRRQVYEGSF